MDSKKRQRQIALFLGDEEIALGLITEARARALVEQRKATWRRCQAAVQLELPTPPLMPARETKHPQSDGLVSGSSEFIGTDSEHLLVGRHTEGLA